MFWKKPLHEEIISKYGNNASSIFSEGSQKNLEQLKDMIGLIGMSASMIDQRKGELHTRKAYELMPKCMFASYLLGYVGMDTNNFLDQIDDENGKYNVIDMITNICLPLAENVHHLVEISHAPGRITMLRENKDQVKQNAIEAIYSCATNFYNDGVKQQNRRSK